jgi:hypothetical protein
MTIVVMNWNMIFIVFDATTSSQLEVKEEILGKSLAVSLALSALASYILEWPMSLRFPMSRAGLA